MRFVFGLAACLLVSGMPVPQAGIFGLPFGEAPAAAQGTDLSEAGFQAYLPRLRADAERAGIRAETLDRIFPTLTFSALPGGAATPASGSTHP